MPAIYFVDVPEFGVFSAILSAEPGIRSSKSNGYVLFTSDRPILIKRAETKLEQALWFGSLVAGFEGKIDKFTDEELRIA